MKIEDIKSITLGPDEYLFIYLDPTVWDYRDREIFAHSLEYMMSAETAKRVIINHKPIEFHKIKMPEVTNAPNL